MAGKEFCFKYSACTGWLIFWLIVFFPIGLVLLLSHLEVIAGGRRGKLRYNGSRFWLFFWALVFFPVSLLLCLFKGKFIIK